MGIRQRLLLRCGAALFCLSSFVSGVCAQQAPVREPVQIGSLQQIIDPLIGTPQFSTVRSFAALADGLHSRSSPPPPGRAPYKFDFNLDTKPDLLFQNADNGELVYWLMDGDHLINYGFLNPSRPGPNWVVAASADFNGDNKTDLVLQATDTGDLIYWLLDGPNQIDVQYFSPRNPGQYWDIVGAADINRDGFADLVFQNSLTGDIYVWYMHGALLISGAYINPRNPGAGWKVAAVGDLNGDGYADLIFQKKLFTPGNSINSIYVWYMQGDTRIDGGFTAPAEPGAAWNVVGLVDLLSQGKPQIVFQNAGTGDLAYWVMNGLNLVWYDLPKPNKPGPTWKLVGAK